ncbi:BcsR/BcsP family cellulose biosynthesis protein [Pseudomonas aeruginosa]
MAQTKQVRFQIFLSQREQLAAALKRWPLLAEFAQQK